MQTAKRGGANRGQGRHRKDCTCPKCIARDFSRAAKSDAPDPIKDETPLTPPEIITPETPPPPLTPETPKIESVDFSRYKQATPLSEANVLPGGNNATANPQTSDAPIKRPRTGKGATVAPVQPPPPVNIVAINGTVLMAIINFICPAMFAYLGNFVTKGYQANDFRLDKNEMRDLIPAADVVAKQVFANIPPMAQLIIGYGAISWSKAAMNKSLRSKS